MTSLGPGSGFGVNFGSYGGRFDEKLSEKIDELVGNKHETREEKLANQLRAMGVDPDKLPLKPEDAKRHAWAFLGSWDDFDEVTNDEGGVIELGCEALELVGSSLGFSRVIVHGKGEDYDHYDDENGYVKYHRSKSLTAKDLDEDKWHDLERVWDAFKADYGNRVKVWAQYSGHDEPESVAVKFATSPKKLKTGQTARIQKGDELVYVRVGSLFDDNELTNLQTMQPVGSLTGWTVVEVIED
jgi:hypothetical protein